MVYCPRCGTEITGRSNFCPSCGLDLSVTTPIAGVREPTQTTDYDIVRETLKEEYEILAELGRGGMAIVYRAREVVLDREVALKVLPFSLSHDAEFVERFQREARTAAKLEHANIVPIYRVGRSGNVIYFVMKFLRGKSLADILEERGQIGPQEIRRMLAECAGALGYAHKHDIVHRDIKPDNIMFAESGQAVLTDFGIAKAATGTRLTGTGMAIGTPYYMSPEQARAHPLDGRTDLYSLGVVAYQCLTGSVPFDGEDSFSISYKHIMEEIPTPELDTTEQYALFRVIRRMMAKDPNDRFQSAEELIEVLAGRESVAVPSPAVTSAPTVNMGAVAAGERSSSTMSAMRPGTAPTPTTPMPRTSVTSLRVAGRRKKRSGALVGMFFLLVLGGAGGGGYYYLSVVQGTLPVPEVLRRLASGATARGVASADRVAVPVPDSAVATAVDSVASDSATVVVGAARDSAAGEPPASDSAPSVAELPNTGTLVLAGLPSGARLRIDGDLLRGTIQTLDAGTHRVEVEAQGFEDYSRPALVPRGDTVIVVVEMTPVEVRPSGPDVPRVGTARAGGASQCEQFNDTYNVNGECFDSRPVPLAAPLVPLPAQMRERPSPAVLAVRVEADGSVSKVLPVRPSDNNRFTILALRYAQGMRFSPAMRNGQPVAAWHQQPFAPRPR